MGVEWHRLGHGASEEKVRHRGVLRLLHSTATAIVIINSIIIAVVVGVVVNDRIAISLFIAIYFSCPRFLPLSSNGSTGKNRTEENKNRNRRK